MTNKFLPQGTWPVFDEEKSDGHLHVPEEPLQHESSQPHAHRQAVSRAGARHCQPV